MMSRYGVFKCLGCEHYLSGDFFDCKKDCARTEDGIEQVECRIKDINFEIKVLNKKKTYLLKQKTELLAILLAYQKKLAGKVEG